MHMAIKHLTYAAIPLIAASLNTQAATVDQLNRQVQKLNQRLAAQDQRFRVNGFASFGFAISDEEMAYNGVNDEISFNRFSKAGVQMTFNMDAKNSVVMQLVSRGDNNWETNAEWAYFKHEFGGGLSGKIGRIRLPAYQLSEFLDVGYATPYAQVPAETYDSLDPFSNMEGVDLSYSMDVGDNIATFQFVYGRAKDNEFDLKDILGVSGIFQADTWSARLGYATASVDIVEPDAVSAVTGVYAKETTGLSGSFLSVGFTYDPGDLYFTTEFTQLEADGPVVDADAIYATVGYRMGRLMPTLTYAMAESKDDDERTYDAVFADNAAVAAGFGDLATLQAAAAGGNTTAQDVIAGVEGIQAASDRNTTRIGLGLRYDMSPGTALKVQYDIIEVKDDKSGLFDDTAWATNSANGAANPDGTNVLTISIDTVF
jgi:predicted porin